MKCISLGPGCSIRYNTYTDGPTYFFDWLVSPHCASVLKVLESKDIEKDLSNFHKTGVLKNPSNNKSRIYFNDLDLVSIHDLNETYTSQDVSNFIDKYVRRHQRLIEALTSAEPILFIRKTYITPQFASRFQKLSNKPLISMCHFKENNTLKMFNDKILQKHGIIYVNLDCYSEGDTQDWTDRHINWKQIIQDVHTI